jgi:dethiobiotin synthetase
MTRGLFVTGTNTEVGKTVVSRGIARALVDRGLEVAALKPVESGAPLVDGSPAPADALALARAARFDGPLEEVCAYSFAAPVSPHLAAAREGRAIEPGPILDLVVRRAAGADAVVVEGAGGLLVPLSDGLTYADLVARTGLALLIVAPDVLGTINATLLTVEAALGRGIEVAGVVLNMASGEELGNAAAIARHGRVPVIGALPRADGADDDALASLVREHLDWSALDRVLGE